MILGAVGTAAAFVLAGVFIWAAVAKLADRAGTRTAVAEFGLPERLAPAGAIALPLAELAAALLLVVGATRVVGAALALGLLVVFSAAIATSLARGEAPDCHCFGQLHAEPTSWKTLVRNAVLAGLGAGALVAAVAGETPSPVAWLGDLSATGILAVAGGAAALALAAAGSIAFFSLTRSYGRVLLRLEAAELRLAGESDEDQLGITPDTPAPDFLVSDATGAAVTLADLLAPELPVLLVFTSPTCGPCHELLPDVARWQREHGDRLTIAVVNGGDVDAAHAEAAEHELQHVLVDHELALYEAYGANGTPSAALVSPDGMLASWIAAGAATIEELMQESLRAQWTRQDEEGLAVGTPAPELDLTGLDGDRVSLSDPNGRDTLVLFWNPDCGFCRDMHEDLLHWERKAPAESPRVLVVSAGDEESTRAEGFSSTIVLDPEFSVGEPFGATGTPMAVLVDREGRIGSPLATGKEAVLGLAGAT